MLLENNFKWGGLEKLLGRSLNDNNNTNNNNIAIFLFGFEQQKAR